MSAYTEADVLAATKATIGHHGEQCQAGWLCRCGFTGDTASLDDHFASLVLDAVAPAIAARAKAEALREAARSVRQRTTAGNAHIGPDGRRLERRAIADMLQACAAEIERT